MATYPASLRCHRYCSLRLQANLGLLLASNLEGLQDRVGEHHWSARSGNDRHGRSPRHLHRPLHRRLVEVVGRCPEGLWRYLGRYRQRGEYVLGASQECCRRPMDTYLRCLVVLVEQGYVHLERLQGMARQLVDNLLGQYLQYGTRCLGYNLRYVEYLLGRSDDVCEYRHCHPWCGACAVILPLRPHLLIYPENH